MTGGARPEADYVAQMEQAGADRVLFLLPSAEKDEVLPLLDRYAGLTR